MSRSRMLLSFIASLMLLAFFMGCASTSKSSSTGEYIDDTVVTAKVKALMIRDTALKSFQISVETYKGVVQLSGFVDSTETKEKADFIARTVKGVQSVTNNLIIK